MKAARPCIMAVDDDGTVREMLLLALGGRYNVICLPSGEDIADLVTSYMPNLLILDINLPGQDGFAVCRELRGLTLLRPVPILFLSVRKDDRSFLRGLESGGAAYLSKPFDVSALHERVEYLLKSYRAA